MQGNLYAAIAMAQHLEVYHGGDGAKAGGSGVKGSQNMKKQKRGNVVKIEGSSSRWSRPSKSGQRRVRGAKHKVRRKPRGEDANGYSATIVAEIISCVTTWNGKR